MQDNDLGDDFSKLNEETFKAICEKYVYLLMTLAKHLLGRKEDVEDIVVEAFTNLWKLRDRFDTIPNIKAILFMSVRNGCINILRKDIKQNATLLAKAEELDDIPDNVVIEVEFKKRLRTELEHSPVELPKNDKL